jgi:hypothetical protein
MTCKDCGYAVSMNKTSEKPLQPVSDILKHMTTHNVPTPSHRLGASPDQMWKSFAVIELPSAPGVSTSVNRPEAPIAHLSLLPPDAGACDALNYRGGFSRNTLVVENSVEK